MTAKKEKVTDSGPKPSSYVIEGSLQSTGGGATLRTSIKVGVVNYPRELGRGNCAGLRNVSIRLTGAEPTNNGKDSANVYTLEVYGDEERCESLQKLVMAIVANNAADIRRFRGQLANG